MRRHGSREPHRSTAMAASSAGNGERATASRPIVSHARLDSETRGVLILEHEPVARPSEIGRDRAVPGTGAPSNSICSILTWS